MAENTKVTRNGLSIVKTKRGHQWRMHDHTGAVIAASSQYYASSNAAKRAANRAAIRMHKHALANGLVTLPAAEPQGNWLDEDDAHGSVSTATPAAKRTDAKPQPRSRFGFLRRG
jgi:hypothetical protein